MQGTKKKPGQLVLIHYHLRPGGVRRVMEMYLPALAASGVFEGITLLAGECAEPVWEQNLRATMRGAEFSICIDPAVNYHSGREPDAAGYRRRLRTLISHHAGEGAVVWAHNLGLGRNIFLAAELAAWSAETGSTLLSHHHDLWFDNRWARWPELELNGFDSLEKLADAVFGTGASVMHCAINSADQSLVARSMPGRSVWLPNPMGEERRPLPVEIGAARVWLREELGHDGPVWIFPTRFLRRKNLAEAVLLARWLQPDAMLVTTAGVSSPEETVYAHRLETAVREGSWPVRFKLLSGRDGATPSVPALMCAADKVLLTSIQEGFGLPFIEAASLQRPLLARRLGNVDPDLSSLGFEIPGLYEEVMVPTDLFDFSKERRRQEMLFESWKNGLPTECRSLAEKPLLLDAEATRPVPFSRLTLDAQLEVLALPPDAAWAAALKFNPVLLHAFEQSANPPTQSAVARNALSPSACAARLLAAMESIPPEPVSHQQAAAAQRNFITERLRAEFLFPLLMQP